uniref:Uncharacterized protein n=1 Tax=Sphaerodactylus townsendi TaxID=933632 RepID=A0ACB8FM24_9SAUR
MAAGGGSVSARSLARSVAHRLKYYVDVQRKENCFDSSGLIRDEMESCDWNTSPLRLIEWEHGRPLEHDFAKIKLEASLRMYVGSTEECHQKVRKSPEKQKDVEKFIKEMARQDYIPDLKNDGRAKRTQRQSYWQRTPSSLHRAAIPTMSAEEVRRLISSSSKFVVAATSEVFPKVLGTTQGADSTPKRRAARTVPSLDHAGERTLSSTRFHKDEAESCIQERNEEFHTELDQKASEKNGGKKPKTTKKRKKGEDQNMPVGLTNLTKSTGADANVGNHDKDHSGKLLNQILSFHGGDAKAVDEPTGQWQINDLIFGDSWDQQVTYIPPALLGAGEISEEEDGSSAPPQVKRCVPRSLGDETSDEEFTISSASRCSSAKSLASQERRNTNAEQKEEEANAGSSVQMCVPNVTKESTVQRGMFEEHSEKLRSSAEEKGTNKDRGPEYLSAALKVQVSAEYGIFHPMPNRSDAKQY